MVVVPVCRSQMFFIGPSAKQYKSVSHIAELEYHISFDARGQTYQSPNRKHNLRAHNIPGETPLVIIYPDPAAQTIQLKSDHLKDIRRVEILDQDGAV